MLKIGQGFMLRIHPASINMFKSEIIRLSKITSVELGRHSLSNSLSLDLAAATFGYKDFNELVAISERTKPDECLDEKSISSSLTIKSMIVSSFVRYLNIECNLLPSKSNSLQSKCIMDEYHQGNCQRERGSQTWSFPTVTLDISCLSESAKDIVLEHDFFSGFAKEIRNCKDIGFIKIAQSIESLSRIKTSDKGYLKVDFNYYAKNELTAETRRMIDEFKKGLMTLRLTGSVIITEKMNNDYDYMSPPLENTTALKTIKEQNLHDLFLYLNTEKMITNEQLQTMLDTQNG